MKKLILACALALCSFCILQAQRYEPRERWPFIYEDFQKGAARTRAGALVTEAPLNISVIDGSLLYVDDNNKIMQADISKIYTVKIGEDVYVNIVGKLYRLLSELDLGLVLLETAVDANELSKVDIGYGVSSASASAMNVTILLDGRSNVINTNIEQTSMEKYSSNVLPVKETRYLFVKGRMVPATKGNLLSFDGIDKKAAQAFIKQEKIKWKETESLEKLIIFLDNQFSD